MGHGWERHRADKLKASVKQTGLIWTLISNDRARQVAQLVGAWSSLYQKVVGSILSQCTCLGCRFDTQSGHTQEAID